MIPFLCPPQVPPGGNKTQYEEISIPVALLSHSDLQDIFQVGPRSRYCGFWVLVPGGAGASCPPP